jgi:hypothetical protein
MDKYDEQIQRLLDDPSITHEQWNCWHGIFQCAGNQQGFDTGCLTQIRTNKLPDHGRFLYHAFTPELTKEIENDERIPFYPEDVKTREQMEVLAEWQRRIDREFRNVPAIKSQV